jgi:tripeptide aminopeptidase
MNDNNGTGHDSGADDNRRALDTFLELVRMDSPSGHEDAVAAHLLGALQQLGVDAARDATGNVVGRRPGKGAAANRPPLLLGAHMDTVSPGIGVKPVVEHGVVRSSGDTVLGADDKAGITAILEALRRTHGTASYRPVEVLITVEEETGLTGAKGLDVAALQARQGIMLDAGGPVGSMVTRGPAQNTIEATVHGKAAHAGIAPEQGINAIVLAARALAEMRLGRIDEETTANVGVIAGGVATNIVPDRVTLKAETRSRNAATLDAQTRHMVERFQAAAAAGGGSADVTVTRSYGAINIAADSPLVADVAAAMRRAGIEPKIEATGGGSDANVLCAAGIETLNLGVGYQNVHTTAETMSLVALAQICDVVQALVSG